MTNDLLKTMKAAISSDHHSRAAYTGKIKQTETVSVTTEEGVVIEKEVTIFISWDSIDELLKMVRERAKNP